ncbi:glycoside hydrolase [Ruania alkalisoli]|uniref:beta-fructofuranosidase n=1 Tax=Ruania alkalisoli TaxID=2779775 RepID=A0A7M1SP20_9MICO|nr:glycoside hydrolase [Ruania alkalisoli]QOR69316.1 glycoside hydrolase [Ruania alkalisoli]
MSNPFFHPNRAWVGDVIPVERDGEFRLYYLHETRRSPAEGMPWHLVTTRDFVTYTEHGEAIPSGGPDAPDFNVYTGSVVTDYTGTDHLFYTGQNPSRLGPDGRPLQLVMHAISTDGQRTWAKCSEDTFGATADYESGDWRDPFVFWDEDNGQWRMIVTARHIDGPDRRRGVLAQLTSTDLSTWHPTTPLWDPGRHIAHECPDVFRWGDWWYLVYSEFSDSFATKYRMARTLDGPWLAPAHDSLDGRAFYAAKSAARDGRRFFFGWIATKEGVHDDGPWEWAGTLAVLEAHQGADGTLTFAPPAEVSAAFGTDHPVGLGTAADLGAAVDPDSTAVWTTVGRPDGYQAVLTSAPVPATCRIRLELDIPEADTLATGECGILLRTSADGDQAHVLRLEPDRGRMVVDRWPRRTTGTEQWQISGDVPHAVELERPCTLTPGHHTLEILLDEDICVATLDREVTVSTRMYRSWGDHLGIFAADCTVTVTDLRVTTAAPVPAPREHSLSPAHP